MYYQSSGKLLIITFKVGFILPVMFYWKAKADEPATSRHKLGALACVTVIVVVSLLGLIDFIM